MAQIQHSIAAPYESGARLPFILLLIVGSLLACAVLLSKVAAGQHAPMLWYLAAAMAGSGGVLVVTDRQRKTDTARPKILCYSIVAGGFMALGSALGYLSIERVGAAYVALAMAFPTMFTYLLSLMVGSDRFDPLRFLAVAIGLSGGIVLAIGKGLTVTGADMSALAMASFMPVVLAVGNVYRSHYWPKGASPRALAGPMLLCGAAIIVPVAITHHGVAAASVLALPVLLLITLVAIACFALQYVAYFKLQHIAGPVYLSQTGSVAALIGAVASVVFLSETLPSGFLPAALLIAVGIVLFQWRTHHRG